MINNINLESLLMHEKGLRFCMRKCYNSKLIQQQQIHFIS